MCLATCSPLVPRWWQVALLAVAMAASAVAAAQATVATAEFSADVLLAALGTGKAIEIALPDDVRAVHVAATRGEVLVDELRIGLGARSDGVAESVVVSVGAVGPTLWCPLLAFIHVSLERGGRSYRGTMSSTCIEVEAPVGLRPAQQVGFLAASFDVDTWYAIDGFDPVTIGAGAERPTITRPRPLDDEVVFYVYLATEGATAPLEAPGVRPR